MTRASMCAWLIVSLATTVALRAETLEEVYHRALMAEKGEGDLKEAISLYGKVVKKHEPGGREAQLAARSQIRIGICEEKLGLRKARKAYEEVPEKFPDQPRAAVAAALRIRSNREREWTIEAPETDFGPDPMAVYGSELDVSADAILMPQISPYGSRRYSTYAFRQPIIPYAYKTVAEVPMKWKFLPALGDFRRTMTHAHSTRALDSPTNLADSQYAKTDYDDSHWSDILIGQAWEDQGYENYDAGGWYRAKINIDSADEKLPIYMAFGGVDLDGYVYINGQYAGEHHVWDRPFILDITDAATAGQENTIAIYVHDGAGMGGIYGLINVHQPEGEIDVAHLIANKGGSITSRDGLGGQPYSRNWGVRQVQRIRNVTRLIGQGNSRFARWSQRQPYIPYDHQTVADVPVKWKFALDYGTMTPRNYAEYSKADYDDSKWSEIRIGQAWEDQGYDSYDEGAWYRSDIEVNAKDDKKPVYMAFGGIDKDAWIYVNGLLMGEHHVWDRPFILDVSDAVKYHGENAIAIRVYDGQGMGGIYGLINLHQPDVPVDLGSR